MTFRRSDESPKTAGAVIMERHTYRKRRTHVNWLGVALAVILLALLGGLALFVWKFPLPAADPVAWPPLTEAPDASLGRVLVAYYSLSGNTRSIAERLRDVTGGTLYEIEPAEPYAATPALFITVKMQLRRGERPALKETLPNPDYYDTIFVGGPVWWYTLPPPLLSFLSRVDFQGKTVVPFCTYGGKAGDFFDRFRAEAQNAILKPEMTFGSVSKTAPTAMDRQIREWIGRLRQGVSADAP